MPVENVEIVRRAYEDAYAARSVASFVEDWGSEEFRFHMRPEWPGKTSYGASEMTELWADLDETYSDFRLVPTEYEANGDYVLVTLHQSAQLLGTGSRIDAVVFHVWEVRHGRAVQAWTYGEKTEALEAAGLSK